MFGFSFKDRVSKLLESHFNYEPSGAVGFALDGICAEAKRNGANEASAAIMTMLVAMNVLEPSGDPAFDEKIAGFVEHFTPLVLELVDLSNQPSEEVLLMLEQIHEKHGLTYLDPRMPDNLDREISDVCDVLSGTISATFINNGMFPAFEITEFQKKFILVLQMWGAADRFWRLRSCDESVVYKMLAVLTQNEPIDMEPSLAKKAIDLCEEIQDEAWAYEIIRGGKLAMQELLGGTGDGMSLGDVFENKGMLKKVALRIPASL
jgi:hypothetical protein